MKKSISVLLSGSSVFLFLGCAGMKIINPNEPDNTGVLAVDVNGGQVQLVETYTCKLMSIGNRFSALAKSEDEAREEVLNKCRDKTLLSFCDPKKVTCEKN